MKRKGIMVGAVFALTLGLGTVAFAAPQNMGANRIHYIDKNLDGVCDFAGLIEEAQCRYRELKNAQDSNVIEDSGNNECPNNNECQNNYECPNNNECPNNYECPNDNECPGNVRKYQNPQCGGRNQRGYHHGNGRRR